ncbi:hypothetical protein V6N11_008325 [Hibiscus sabdariffa]|uniref:RNase H type-1 domain-containing protein n=1 Tax=Hibiscus sabdariffa TaxID=183260 RepID=A0ABR2Q0B5_9ROSI
MPPNDAALSLRVHGVRQGERAACGVGWASKSALVVELDNEVLVKWLMNPLQRPWGIARSFAEIDTLVCDCTYVQLELAASLESSLMIKLAQDGVNRKD